MHRLFSAISNAGDESSSCRYGGVCTVVQHVGLASSLSQTVHVSQGRLFHLHIRRSLRRSCAYQDIHLCRLVQLLLRGKPKKSACQDT